MTICIRCRHCTQRKPGLFWDNYRCKASPRKEVIDPVTGERGYAAKNDLGRPTIRENRFDVCRDVNDGMCEKFEARQWINVSLFKKVFK